MGQQQLLLLVLGAIIVGVSIVVGVGLFTTGATNANRDAVINDCMTIAARAQIWYRTPAFLGGGGRTYDNVSIGAIKFPASNENASSYSITGSGRQATIEASGVEPHSNPGSVTVVIVPDSIRTPVFGDGWQ